MIKPFSHVVVDGSNLATEGRTEPSLKQLNEAVLAFMKEFPGTKLLVTIVRQNACLNFVGNR
ncbi:MAG: hypothetical protein ACKO73_01825, partial [Acidimicrobiaceae bacterium]